MTFSINVFQTKTKKNAAEIALRKTKLFFAVLLLDMWKFSWRLPTVKRRWIFGVLRESVLCYKAHKSVWNDKKLSTTVNGASNVDNDEKRREKTQLKKCKLVRICTLYHLFFMVIYSVYTSLSTSCVVHACRNMYSTFIPNLEILHLNSARITTIFSYFFIHKLFCMVGLLPLQYHILLYFISL